MEDEQEICRVCRSESTPDHPLFHPCKCSGSIRFIHQDCLSEWLTHSKKDYCELCEYRFTFTPIYKEDMPRRLPLKVLFRQFFYRLGSLIKTLLRGLIVTTVWLIVLPLFTLWTWRLCFWTGERIGYTNDPNNGNLPENHPSQQNTTFVETSPSSSSPGFNFETFFTNPGSAWSFLNKR
ncbi:RING-variant domain-containing protein [Phycomyces blakesleeanus]|uniref:RING-type E3 ubiquitin transferase n=1 Tax=Phycomyces blakesleeanus TaxID=4837 RepID=A0ABR3BC03_PHYBL